MYFLFVFFHFWVEVLFFCNSLVFFCFVTPLFIKKKSVALLYRIVRQHKHVHSHTDSTATPLAWRECHTVAWCHANISANCQHMVRMQNSWAGAKHSGARTRWSYPSKERKKKKRNPKRGSFPNKPTGTEFHQQRDIPWIMYFPTEPRCSLMTLELWSEAFLMRTNQLHFSAESKKSSALETQKNS